MQHRLFVFAAILWILLSIIPVAADDALAASTEVSVTVADTVINNNIIGLGWNVSPLYMPTPKLEKQNDLDEFFRLFGQTGQPWIRLVLYSYEWEYKITNGDRPVYENDDNNPWTSPKEFLSRDFKGFAWNTPAGLDWRLIYLLDFCEQHDIHVMVNNWETWMKRWLDHKKDADGHVSYEEALAKAQEFGENVASLIYYLKTTANHGHGYKCIKYFALWNEPGGGYNEQDFVSFDFPGYLNLLTKAVHEHLVFYDKEMNTHVRDELECMGFDSFANFRNSPASGHPMQPWEEMIGKGVIRYLEPPDNLPGEITTWPDGDPYMDMISIHEYWSVFDYDKHNPSTENHGTIEDNLITHMIKKSMNQIAQYDMDNKIEPLVIGELGAKAYRVSEYVPAEYSHTLCIAESAIRALQAGVKGVSLWAWNMHTSYAALTYPGCWWQKEPADTVKPVNANYYPYSLLTRNIKRNCDMLGSTVTGGADDSKGDETWPIEKAQRVWAGAFRNPDKTITLVIVNDSYLDKHLSVTLPAACPGLTKHVVSQQQYDNIDDQPLPADSITGSTFTDALPPRSIVVYTGSL